MIADPELVETVLNRFVQGICSKPNNSEGFVRVKEFSDVYEYQVDSLGFDELVSAIIDRAFGVDMLVLPDRNTLPKIFVSDMDSTMIEQECIDELADFAGFRKQIADITDRAMKGELDFEKALRQRVGLLKGVDITAIQDCLHERITVMKGAETLVATLKKFGCKTILVTGGFTHFAEPVSELIGFDEFVANTLDIEGGRLTGKLQGPIINSKTKLETLVAEQKYQGYESSTLAIGDGANDSLMLQAADYGIAYKAKNAAKRSANGWIEVGDLKAVLKLFLIPEKDWVRH